MANLSEKIHVELENIENVLKVIPPHKKLPDLSSLELAGVAALLHNFYNGIENIIKQIFTAKNLELPEGQSWHKELLEKAVKEEIISEECKNYLGQYLAFRHFFSHAYALDLHPYKLEPLVENLQNHYMLFRNGISIYL